MCNMMKIRIDVERLIDVVVESYEAYADYNVSLKNLYKGDCEKIEERKKHLEYAHNYHDRQNTALYSVCEVFKFDKEQIERLHIAARAVTRWRIATNWERSISEDMKEQIANFIWGN